MLRGANNQNHHTKDSQRAALSCILQLPSYIGKKAALLTLDTVQGIFNYLRGSRQDDPLRAHLQVFPL